MRVTIAILRHRLIQMRCGKWKGKKEQRIKSLSLICKMTGAISVLLEKYTWSWDDDFINGKTVFGARFFSIFTFNLLHDASVNFWRKRLSLKCLKNYFNSVSKLFLRMTNYEECCHFPLLQSMYNELLPTLTNISSKLNYVTILQSLNLSQFWLNFFDKNFSTLF